MPADTGISLNAVPKAPVEDTSLTASETLEAFVQLASNLSTYASPLPTEVWQPLHTPRFQPPLHSVHLIPPHQKFDSSSMPVPVVKSSVLPIIQVPVRLQHGECAHYSIGATLCSARISSSTRATYPLLDQGLLILTNRRVLYMGKRCQFTLAYTHLWYVSLLHTAIALHIEGQFRRIIIELEHPQEWASRIELLSFIARRARPELPTLSVAAVPGLNMTAKRPVVKPPAAQSQPLLDIATVPQLAERATSKVVEAATIDLSELAIQACADHKTLDFPSVPGSEAPLELVKSNTPRIANQPAQIAASGQQPEITDAPTQAMRQSDIANLATREFDPSGQQPEITDAPTQAMCQSDIANLATREFDPPVQQPEITDAPTQAMCQSDIANLATREFDPPVQQPEITDAPTQAMRQSDIASLATREFDSPGQQPEITDAPTQAMRQAGFKQAEPCAQNQADEDEDSDCTIHLNERKLCQLRTASMRKTIPERPPNSEASYKSGSRIRVSRTGANSETQKKSQCSMEIHRKYYILEIGG